MTAQIFKEFYFWSILLVSVLIDATPPPGHIATPDNDQNPPKYEYGYIVSDQASTQGHVESRDGIYALGRYHVTLPDGSAQKVTYFADDWGYHPLVSYASSTEHGSSRTEFAMGDAAVAALKQTSSPIANLLSDPAPTQPISTISSAQEQFLNTPTNVQISNVGASGHHDQSFASPSASTTVAPPTVTTIASTIAPHVTHITQAPPTIHTFTGTGVAVTTESPSIHEEQIHQQSLQVQNGKIQASLEEQSQISEKARQAAIQAQIQQQEEVQTIQNQLSQHIQETINKLEAHQNLEESKQEVIKQSSLFVPEKAEQQIQEIQNSFNLNQQKTENEISQLNSVSESPLQQSFSYNVHQNYAQAVAPTQQHISSYAQQSISVAPTQQLIIANQQAPSLLTQETPNYENKVEIVTPTSVTYEKQESYPVLSSNSIAGKSAEDESTFTVDGQSVQITSYLADTNKVFNFGDRIRNKDQQAEQRLIDQVEKHAKLRIFQDLQKNSEINSFDKPIVVTNNPSPTAEISIVTARPASEFDINTAIYSSGYSTIKTQTPSTIEQLPQPSPSYAPLISNGYLETNSLSNSAVEKSDYSQSQITVNHGGYGYHQPYISSEHLASLQAGLTLISQEKPSAPVNEDYQETKTVVDAQKGIAYKVPQQNQPEIEQYQALGYERRLVDQRAQQVVNEKDPVLQELKAQDLAVRQEIELQQVQQNLQELQKKIVNEIDAQHEEEQRKQEAVANERQKHLDNLQKVADLLQGVQSIPQDHQSYIQQSISSGQHYEAPQYLPPTPTPHTQQTVYQNYESPVHYHSVAISSPGQNVQSYAHEVKVENVQYENPSTVVDVEKPVYIENTASVESTKVVEVEKPVVINEAVPNVVEVEKTVPVVQPYPVTVTRVVTVDRPVAVPTPYGVPQPVPLPYAVPHAVGVPIPHLIPYPELYPIAFKQYHPVFIHTKSSPHKVHDMKPSKRMPDQVFREPKPELFHHSLAYHTIPLHMKGSPLSYPTHKSSYYRHYPKSHPSHSGRNRNSLKNLRIEYGGFKPPLIPSTEFSEEPKPSPYGPSIKEE